MDPISALSGAQTASTQNSISIAVARKSLDAQKQQGDAVNAMIESAKQVGEAAAHAQDPNKLDTYA